MNDENARVRSTRRRVARVVALLVVVALAGLWLARKPIAGHYIDRALAGSGVPVRYEIADLGLGRQRLTNVVIGDPAAPDLVADWIETETAIGFSGATLSGVRAGQLRVNARLVDGRVRLGAIDRLLPASSGKRFALPKLALDVADGRMRLQTPYGIAGIALTGSGRLDNGFRGRIAVVAARLARSGCAARRAEGIFAVRTGSGGEILLDGPARIAAIACRGVRTGALSSDVAARIVTADRLRWSLDTRLAIADVAHPTATARSIAGRITASDAGRGKVALAGSDVRAAGLSARRVAVDGDVAFADAAGFRGTIALTDATAPIPATLATLGAGTPLAPVAQRLTKAASAAAARFAGDAQVDFAEGRLHVARAALTATSGARLTMSGGEGISWTAADGLAGAATVALAGGDLPAITAQVRRTAGATRGTATVAPYGAAGSRIDIAPLRFASTATSTRVVTSITVSGPFSSGSVDALSLPLALRWDRGGTLALNPGCAPLAWQRLTVSGLTLDPARVTLCPTAGALVRVRNGRVTGGARLGATRLAGRLGTTPIAILARTAQIGIGDRGFAVADLATTLGPPARTTRLAAARLTGTLTGGAIAGRFAGAAGQIANVPLLLGGGAGDWSLAGGILKLRGAMSVSDAAESPRFQPLDARAVAFRLAGGSITASGTLHEPTRGVSVAAVAIRHDLPSGRGDARITVPGITFDETFQPELLTRLTFGVIAQVRGSVTGTGAIDWSPAGVTSTGRFATANTDLAAAFGPVTGIAATIDFTDLLALESAPAQVATVATINPGIPVTDGRITYQTYRGSRVLVNGARWPFAGGTLTLDPTLLDFSTPQARRLTFRIDGAAADQFLQQFDFKNLDATGTFDGVLPMVFDDAGGRIEGGRLAVRAGGGSLAYVGELTQQDLGIWGNIAFQALKSLRYRDLGIVMNGPLAGEMVTEVRFAGISQGEGAKSNFLVRRLQRLPFVFNIRIKAPFRGLLDSAASFYDPSRLIQRNLPQLLERQNRAPAKPIIQPPASETMP